MTFTHGLKLCAVYGLSLLITAALAIGGVMLVAGPHAGLLPGWAEQAVLALGWLAVLGLPMVITRAAHNRWGVRRSKSSAQSRGGIP